MDSSSPDTDGNLYFFDYQQARDVALQRNQVSTIHPTITMLQVCFYDGPSQASALDNMVNLPFEKIEPLLLDSPYQLPDKIIHPIDAHSSFIEETNQVFTQSLYEINQNRKILRYQLKQKIKKQAPGFQQGTPLRILLFANRLTTVMQYCSLQLAKELRKLGHEVLLYLEENDMQTLNNYLHIKTHQEFNPHVIFSINHLNTQYLHPDVFYFSWWQDPMPAINRGTTLHWRERDITLSAVKTFDKYLSDSGCPNIQRQHFCIDDATFNTNYYIQRENKIVFVGSSYRSKLHNNLNEKAALQDITTQMELGKPISEVFLKALSQRWNIDYKRVYWVLFHYAARDITLQWLCRNSKIPVEVYGRGWEEDPIVQPFFLGEIPHGKAVAQIYNSARYALVCHPFEINSQRLAEVAACGCAPVVFDCRHIAEPPFWEDYCCFFRTPEQLHDCLKQQETVDPTPMSRSFSYGHLARFVINTVNKKLGWE